MPRRHHHQRQMASFFVRLWLESGAESEQWRGQVRHVQSGEVAYFVNVQELLRFMAAHGGQAFIPSRKEVSDNAVPGHADTQPGKLPECDRRAYSVGRLPVLVETKG